MLPFRLCNEVTKDLASIFITVGGTNHNTMLRFQVTKSRVVSKGYLSNSNKMSNIKLYPEGFLSVSDIWLSTFAIGACALASRPLA